jgi:ABC-type multidrug transport system ATPase subunit/uncharacterized tellurite resistance protein B-like protein
MEKSTYDKKTLEHTLLSDTVKLFALIALADGVLTEQEEKYIKKYFNALYPQDFADFLFSAFLENTKEVLITEEIIANIKTRLKYEEKIFLLIKLYELVAIDGVDDLEAELLLRLVNLLELNEKDLKAVEQITLAKKSSEINISTASYKILKFSNNLLVGDVYLPFEDLDFIIIYTGHEVFLLQKDDKNEIKIGEHKANPHFTYKLHKGKPITINSKYNIEYEDIIFYYKNQYREASTFFLLEQGSEYELSKNEANNNAYELNIKGCKIEIHSLKDYSLAVNNQPFLGKTFVNLDDYLTLEGNIVSVRSLVMQELLEKSSYNLESGKSVYTIGNSFECDIWVNDDITEYWQCSLEIKNDSFYLNIKGCPYPVFVNNKAIKKVQQISLEDEVRIKHFVIYWNKKLRKFEKIDARFKKIKAEEIEFVFKDSTKGLDNISFNVNQGEFVGVMGPSGSGKSTLMNVLNGFYSPKTGHVVIDDLNLHQHYTTLKDYIGYVPQDDLLFENLTVFENLYYNAKLRYPNNKLDLTGLVDNVLRDIELYEKRNVKVGSPTNKILSGGERKRVNIGLELLSESDIIFFDEPTSGLSSKDSEVVLSLIRQLALQGKMIFTVIHQPSSKLYRMFDKIILLDRGGKLAFFGSSYEALEYFKKYSDDFDYEIDFVNNVNVEPDLLLDTLEQHLTDIDGSLLPIRKYSPKFWQEEYLKYKKQKTTKEPIAPSHGVPEKIKQSHKEQFNIFKILLSRNFKNKLRNKSNLIITFLVPPLLGILTGSILHHSIEREYTFYHNQHIPTFIFLAVLVSIFLGMTNSVEEVIKDKHILLRERMLNIGITSYYWAKFLPLLLFAFIQNILFVGIGFSIIGAKELYLGYILILTITSCAGIALGLLISSIPYLTSKAAVNIVPIILVPQIIFGGALVQYERMNKSLTIMNNSPIPEICHVMPSRWGFEGLMTYQGLYNSYHAEDNQILKELDQYTKSVYSKKKVAMYEEKSDSITAAKKFNAEKEVLTNQREEFRQKYKFKYGNSIVESSMQNGERDYKKLQSKGEVVSYPLFVATKKFPFTSIEIITPIYNTIILLIISGIVIFITIVVLKKFYF